MDDDERRRLDELANRVEEARERNDERFEKRAARWVSVALGTAAILAALITVTQLPNSIRQDEDARAQAVLSQRLERLQGRIDRLASEIDALKTEGDEVPALASLATSLRGVDGRLRELETAIGDSPAKALQVPLLRRDLDNLAAVQADVATSIQSDIDQQYDLTKWLIGTLALGILAMLVSGFAGRRKE